MSFSFCLLRVFLNDVVTTLRSRCEPHLARCSLTRSIILTFTQIKKTTTPSFIHIHMYIYILTLHPSLSTPLFYSILFLFYSSVSLFFIRFLNALTAIMRTTAHLTCTSSYHVRHSSQRVKETRWEGNWREFVCDILYGNNLCLVIHSVYMIALYTRWQWTRFSFHLPLDAHDTQVYSLKLALLPTFLHIFFNQPKTLLIIYYFNT